MISVHEMEAWHGLFLSHKKEYDTDMDGKIVFYLSEYACLLAVVEQERMVI